MGNEELTSKVLIHESNKNAEEQLKTFFNDHHLIGLKDQQMKVMEIFNCNTDLGAAFLCEEKDALGRSGLDIGIEIHRIRPEVPLFLRVSDSSQKLSEEFQHIFAGSYSLEDMEGLSELVKKHLFTTSYPVPLIRGIQEISLDAFKTGIDEIDVMVDPPFLVNDQIIFGELFSLIPLESNWCRGFMMLQTTEEEIRKVIASGKTGLITIDPSFRDVNHILNEITNLIWGGIKSKFFTTVDNSQEDFMTTKIHVPILVNHEKKFISFGTNEPHLCFKYYISDIHESTPPIVIYQKLIFNLSWQPELFKESEQAVDDMVDSGELEFF